MPLGRGLLCIATVFALAITVRSLALQHVSFQTATLLLACYVGILWAGLLFPCLGMFADVVCHGPSRAPNISLTFDGGPHPVRTKKVLDMLDAVGARATFFVFGIAAESHPEILSEIIDRGHEIGICAYQQDRAMCMRTQKSIGTSLERAIHAVEKATGFRPTLFRPCTPLITPRINDVARRLGLTIVGWSVSARDDVPRASAREVAKRVFRGLRPGVIVKLHDGVSHEASAEPNTEAPVERRDPSEFAVSNDTANTSSSGATLDALPLILDEAFCRRLRCVDVVELMSNSDDRKGRS